MFRSVFVNNFSIFIFFLGLVFVIILSLLFPSLGQPGSILYPRTTSKFAICVIFLISSLKVSPSNIINSIKNIKVMFFSIFFCFFIYPLIGWFFGTIINILNIKECFSRGYIIATCMPPPVSAGIVLTGIFKGDEGLAMTISAVGNILAAFISPFLINLLAENKIIVFDQVITLKFLKLAGFIFIPTILGQMFRNCFSRSFCESKKLAFLSKISLLYIIFCGFSFSSSDKENRADLLTLFILLTSICAINVIMYVLVIMADYKFGITRDDSEFWAFLFSVTMKSLGTGVAILLIWSEVDSSLMSGILPLILFEPIQILMSLVIGMGIKKPTQKVVTPV